MKLKLSIAMIFTLTLILWSLPSSAAAGAVYTLSNSSSGNSVIMYNRASDGKAGIRRHFRDGRNRIGRGAGERRRAGSRCQQPFPICGERRQQ